MTTPAATVAIDSHSDDLGARLRGDPKGRRSDRIFAGVTRIAGFTVLVVLAGVVVATTQFAWPAFTHAGWGFLTGTEWSPATDTYGALPLIHGTVVTSAIALVLAVPVSVGLALFIVEACPARLRGFVVGTVDLLAAVPSVVFGLVGLLVFHDPLQRFYAFFAGPDAKGASLATAGIVLACMILPIITSVAREVIAGVPDDRRRAALALGATRAEAIRTVVLPSASGGITSAVMLGLGRALGETVAVALVVGGSVQISADPTQPGSTMAGIIANTFNGEGNRLNQRALMGLGVLLFVITLAVNSAATLAVRRGRRRNGAHR